MLQRLEAIETRLGIAPPRAEQSRPGLPPGTSAPNFRLPEHHGETRSLGSLLSAAGGKPLLLVFADPDCRPCTDLLPELAAFEDEHASAVSVALITRDDGTGDLAAAEQRLRHVLFQEGREVMETYGVPGTPTGVPTAVG